MNEDIREIRRKSVHADGRRLQNPHRGFDSRRRLRDEFPSKSREQSARPKQSPRSQTLTVVTLRGETSGLTRAEARAYLLPGRP